MKSNLVEGNPAAKAQNSPGPMAKQTRSNLVRTQPTAKAKNVPAPLAPQKRANLVQTKPATVKQSDDARIHSELTTGKRNNSHNRGGR